jgi:hypothetical protein
VTSSLLLVLLLAAPPVQDGVHERVRNAISTYFSPRTKAEDRTRIVERLGSMGPAAVRFIQAVADGMGGGGGFPPTRYLAGEVKADLLRRLGDESGAVSILQLRSLKASVEASDVSLESILDSLRRQGLARVLVNPAEQDEVAKLRFSIRTSGEQMDHLLDKVLQRHRLDYYARGTLLIIASRAWLWGPPVPAAADSAVQSRVSEGLGQLDSELVDRRTAAERSIIESGLSAIPLLEKECERASGPRKARMEVLVDRIFERHVPDRLHPVGAEPGFVSEEALTFYRAAKDRTISISFFKPTPLSEIVARISEFSETPVVIDPSLPAAVAGRRVTLAVERGSVLDVLEALFVPLGGALSPEAGRLLVVPRK